MFLTTDVHGRRSLTFALLRGFSKTAERKRGVSVLVCGLINHGLHGLAALTLACFGMAWAAVAAEPTILVEARQRYPWNGLVDINFTITGDAGTKYDTSFTAKDMVGNTNIAMQTIRKADGTTAATREQLLPGTYNWVWDAAADLPKDFKCDRVTVTGTTVEHKYLYMVIDLSGGANASSYPVSYLDAVPSGGWGDTYKTTKLVLRRVPKGSNPAGGSMTKDMWVGIFEVTVGQYERINNVTPVSTQNKKRAMEYVEGGGKGYGYYGAGNVLSALNTKTVLNKIRLPTRAEWEYACRAGTQTAYNNGTSASTENMNKVGWWNGNSNWEVQEVGLKVPNAWGLYDMHGNVEERTSTSWGLMGGTCRSNYSNCTSSHFESPGDDVGRIADGFRVFAEVE